MASQKGWIRLPEELLKRPDISLTAAVVYAILLDRAEQDLNVKISQKKIAEIAGISLSTAKRAINELTKDGWITSHCTEKNGDKLIYHLFEVIPYKYKKKEKEDETQSNTNYEELNKNYKL